MDLKELITETADFPKEGILFRDINPLLKDPNGWSQVMSELSEFTNQMKPDLIAGIESRGFIVGASLAAHQGIGFVPIRKKGKLPGKILGIEYDLEYGKDKLEVQANAFENKSKVLILDDLLATGGTASAASSLVKEAGGELVGLGFVVELRGLLGRKALPSGIPVKSLIAYN